MLSRSDDPVGDDDLEDGLGHARQVAHHEHDHDRSQGGGVVGLAPREKQDGGILAFVPVYVP